MVTTCQALLLSVTEVSVREDSRRSKCPRVDRVTEPGGDDLYPERGLAEGAHLKIVSVTVPPVSENEHQVHDSNHEHEVEEGVAVGNTILLIVVHTRFTLL